MKVAKDSRIVDVARAEPELPEGAENPDPDGAEGERSFEPEGAARPGVNNGDMPGNDI